MQVLGQELEDANILKVLQCFFFSNLRSILLTYNVIKNVLTSSF